MRLGSFPDIGIAHARKLAAACQEQIAEGVDPSKLGVWGEAERRLQQGMPTFETAARLVHEEVKSGFRSSKHSDQWINALETDVFATIGDRKMNEIRASDFAVAFRPILLVKPETASRVR
jgi:hypothetical protein